MPLLTLVAAASFACVAPSHPAGDSIRCAGQGRAMQLEGITAPALAAPCGGGLRACEVDPGTAARDRLADLSRGIDIVCTPRGQDRQGRRIVRCFADGRDLACLQLAEGVVAATGPPLGCAPPSRIEAGRTVIDRNARAWIELPPLWRWIPLYLVGLSIATYAAFALDQRRTRRGLARIAPAQLLTLVAFGGGIGAVIAQQRLGHLEDEPRFTALVIIMIGLQIGAAVGLAAAAYWPSAS